MFHDASMETLVNASTLSLFNIAMENGPFIDDFPINTSTYKGFSMPMLNNQMVVGNKEPKVPVKPLAFAVENGCLPLSPLLASKGESHRQLAYGFL